MQVLSVILTASAAWMVMDEWRAQGLPDIIGAILLILWGIGLDMAARYAK